MKSKIAKTRQGTLDELGGLLKRFGMGTCEPAKAFPVIASAISDKDPNVRKSALLTLRYARSWHIDHRFIDPRAVKDMFLSAREYGSL